MGITSSLSNETKKFFPVKKYRNVKIKTNWRCSLKHENKNLKIKCSSLGEIEIYENNKKIKDGLVFASCKNNKTILSKISINFSSLEECVKLKTKIPGYQIPIIIILNQGDCSNEIILHKKKDKNLEFFINFCGIDNFKWVKYHESFSKQNNDILEVSENKFFLILYCKNIELFLKNKQNKSRYKPFYFKGEGKERVYLFANAVREFYEYIKLEVIDHFNYDDIKKISFLFFGTNKISSNNNIVGINMEYYNFYEKITSIEKDFII